MMSSQALNGRIARAFHGLHQIILLATGIFKHILVAHMRKISTHVSSLSLRSVDLWGCAIHDVLHLG